MATLALALRAVPAALTRPAHRAVADPAITGDLSAKARPRINTVMSRDVESAYVAFKCLDPDGHRIEVYREPRHSQ